MIISLEQPSAETLAVQIGTQITYIFCKLRANFYFFDFFSFFLSQKQIYFLFFWFLHNPIFSVQLFGHYFALFRALIAHISAYFYLFFHLFCLFRNYFPKSCHIVFFTEFFCFFELNFIQFVKLFYACLVNLYANFFALVFFSFSNIPNFIHYRFHN